MASLVVEEARDFLIVASDLGNFSRIISTAWFLKCVLFYCKAVQGYSIVDYLVVASLVFKEQMSLLAASQLKNRSRVILTWFSKRIFLVVRLLKSGNDMSADNSVTASLMNILCKYDGTL